MNGKKKIKSETLTNHLISDMESLTILGGKDDTVDTQDTNVVICITNNNCPGPCTDPHNQEGCGGKA